MLAAGLGALRILHKDINEVLWHWVELLRLDPASRYVGIAWEKIVRIDPKKIHEMALLAACYSALFFAEGIGLWLGKRWAEWLTVVVTGSLIPFEIYELLHKPSAPKLAVLVVNAAIVFYLIFRLKGQKKHSEAPARVTRPARYFSS